MEVRNLTKRYQSRGGLHKQPPAVNDLSFDVKGGRFISIIGESGSGKSTVGKLVLKLLKPTAGSISYMGRDLAGYRKRDMKGYYADVQAIFQDPYSSFNPLFKIDRVLKMVMDSFCPGEKACDDRIEEAIASVGMNPREILGKYPHQLSGGQLQRLLIVRALLMKVKILVADEIISMLDASTRIDILNLLGTLAYEKGMAVLFITHDLSLGYYISEETLIMRKGRIVEMGSSLRVFKNPTHPYTRMLFKSVPDIARKWEKGETFLPEAIDDEVAKFYSANAAMEKGLIETEPDHRVIMTL